MASTAVMAHPGAGPATFAPCDLPAHNTAGSACSLGGGLGARCSSTGSLGLGATTTLIGAPLGSACSLGLGATPRIGSACSLGGGMRQRSNSTGSLGLGHGLGGLSQVSLWSHATSSLLSGSAHVSTVQLSTLSPIQERRAPGGAERPRRFSSRHVPSVAEDIVHCDILTPTMITRFNGLMKYLKNNSEQEDSEKRVLAAEAPDALVPPAVVRALKQEYERRCSFGERTNLELMSSAKWMKLLEDMDVVAPAGAEAVASPRAAGARSRSPERAPPAAATNAAASSEPLGKKAKGGGGPVGDDDESDAATEAPDSEPGVFGERRMLSRAAADIAFRRVLHNCNHGGLRVDYELFCKGLLLVGHVLWPEVDIERVLAHMAQRVVATAPAPGEAQELAEDVEEQLLSADAAFMLERFKPALNDLFDACCAQNLINPGSAGVGAGVQRNHGRPLRKAVPSTIVAAAAAAAGSPGMRLTAEAAAQLLAQAADVGPGASPARADSAQGSPYGTVSGSPASPAPGADDFAMPLSGRWAGADSVGRTLAALNGTRRSQRGSIGAAAQGPMCHFANGTPVIANRRRMMSVDQFVGVCKQMDVLPELLSRTEVIRIFKRAEVAAAGLSHSSGQHGFIARDAFIHAIALVALEAYAKQPFCDEYPGAHDKIHALLSVQLPSKGRKTRDRFLYGRGW